MVRMVKKHLAFLLLAVVCVSFVSAIDTKVEIKTVPGYDVQVAASRANTVAFELLTSSILKTKANENGSAFFLLSFNATTYNLDVNIKKDNITINKTRRSDLISGDALTLDFVPEWAKTMVTSGAELDETNLSEKTNASVENQTMENVTEKDLVAENKTEGNWVSSTGLFIIEKGKSLFTSNMTYYVIAILAIGVFAFVIRRKFMSPAEIREVKIRKLSELNAEREEEKRNNNELREAEARLRDAQARVSKLKNKDKVRELEEKIEEEEEELERLKDSDD